MSPTKREFPNKTAEYFYRLCLLSFASGLPNFWIQELHISIKFARIYRLYSHVVTVLIFVFIISEHLAFMTQKNLNEKQQSDLMMYSISHPMLMAYTLILTRQTKEVKQIQANILCLKKVFNTPEVEKQMINRSKFYSLSFISLCTFSMFMYSCNALLEVLTREGTFTTIVTAWPLVEDNSAAANVGRLLVNFVWWAMMSRVTCVYSIVFSLTACMSHQFIDLQNYFVQLNDTFSRNCLSQTQKEIQYEKGFIIGVKLHADSLRCVEQSKKICGRVYSGQIIFNIVLLVILMSQLVNAERTLVTIGSTGLASFSVVLGTGLFMCNAGDVTVEASHLATSMYLSGWHHCQNLSSVRVKKLVFISMVYAQKSVLMKGLGIMHLSYQSYVSLIKSTYSVFSVLCQQK